MRRTKPHVIEVIPDEALRGREAEVRAAVARFFPNIPALRLYRTTDGAIGCLLDVTVTGRGRKRLAKAFAAMSKVLTENAG